MGPDFFALVGTTDVSWQLAKKLTSPILGLRCHHGAEAKLAVNCFRLQINWVDYPKKTHNTTHNHILSHIITYFVQYFPIKCHIP
jgi:hypothetical protein